MSLWRLDGLILATTTRQWLRALTCVVESAEHLIQLLPTVFLDVVYEEVPGLRGQNGHVNANGPVSGVRPPPRISFSGILEAKPSVLSLVIYILDVVMSSARRGGESPLRMCRGVFSKDYARRICGIISRHIPTILGSFFLRPFIQVIISGPNSKVYSVPEIMHVVEFRWRCA
jgi:hypothetical protein